jgi:hypothetical protein
MKCIKNIWREPLVHFLLIGAGLFLLFNFINGPAGGKPNRIVVSPGRVEQLIASFSQTWLRPPTEDELSGLIKEHVRDEVYYREALAMGLDQNDPLIRRRMRQKLEFLIEDLSAADLPGDAALSEFLQQNPGKFRSETRMSFRQVYLKPDNHQDLEADAGIMLSDLRAGKNPEPLGDPTLLEPAYESIPQSLITRSFGKTFAQEIIKLEPGAWAGPLYSGFGGHLVFVVDRTAGRLPDLGEIRTEVEREYLARKRRELKDVTYSKLLENYEIVIEPVTTEGSTGNAIAASRPEGADQ